MGRALSRSSADAFLRLSLKPRIQRLALKSQHAERALMHQPKRLILHESSERFDPDAELAHGTSCDEIQWLGDHAFAAGLGQLNPPIGSGLSRLRRFEVNQPERSRGHKLRVRSAERSGDLDLYGDSADALVDPSSSPADSPHEAR